MARQHWDSGSYDWRIEIQRRVSTQSAGQLEPTITWEAHAQPWARRQIVRSVEPYQADQFAARVDLIFHLAEYVSELTHDMRVIDRGRDHVEHIYDIRSILPPSRQDRGQELHVYEHAD